MLLKDGSRHKIIKRMLSSILCFFRVFFRYIVIELASAVVKSEIPSDDGLQTKMIGIIRGNPKGIADVLLKEMLPGVSDADRIEVVNRLLQEGKIDLLKSGNQLFYKLKESSSTEKANIGDKQEGLVYQIIKDAGNKGIWVRDIRLRANLPQPQINKILKNLESKKIIKGVTSVAASKKKLYMLSELTPDVSVTGGTWYSNNDFDLEFVDLLSTQSFVFLQNKARVAEEQVTNNINPVARVNNSWATVGEVHRYISDLGISTVPLSEVDIQMVLQTLVYDGKAEWQPSHPGTGTFSAEENTSNTELGKVYRAIMRPGQPAALIRLPCGVCPLIRECMKGRSISPQNCIYLNDWLKF